MKFMQWDKDGGPESKVDGFFFIELKKFFSIVLLRFEGRSRPAFHEHAFNSISWLLKGGLHELHYTDHPKHYSEIEEDIYYGPSFLPITTKRSTFHKVDSNGVSWVLSFRGPWTHTWREYVMGGGWKEGYIRWLTHGRKVIDDGAKGA